jgi:PAS domain S-box-containing protein
MRLRTVWYGLIILASLLPAAALSPWLYQQAHTLLLDRAILTERMFHQALAIRLQLEVKRLSAVLQNKSDPIAYFVSQHRDVDFMRKLLEKIDQREPLLNTTTIYDRHANILLSTHHGKHMPALIDKAAPVFVIPMHKRMFIGSAERLSDKHLEFLIAVPLVANHESLGVMVSTVNIDAFWRSIRAQAPEHHSKVYLIDGRGSLLIQLSDTKHSQGDLLSDNAIVRTLLAGKAWHRSDAYAGFEGNQVFGIGTLVQDLQWGIISEIPSKDITAPIATALITLTMIIVLLHVLFALISLMFIRRLLEPISNMSSVVKHATQGDYSQTVSPSPYREINDLGASFNIMIGEIKIRESTLGKLSQAISQAGESILITNRAGIIEYVNPSFSKLTGYSAEEAMGQTPRLLKSGNQDAAFYEAMWKTITAGKIWHGKVIERRKDGSFYPAVLTISPIFDESGEAANCTHFVGIQSDLSELEDMEHRFQQAQKMEAIGIMVGGIAHNFNNMLAGMTGNLYLAKMKVQAQPDVVKKLANVEELSGHAAEMIQQLLAFARKGIVSMKEMPLVPFIKETLKLLHASVPENIEVHEDICSTALQIKGDVTLLHQVLANLVNNARDALENVDAPCITIRLELFYADDSFLGNHPDFERGSFAHLSVEDNGIGIPEHQLKHLFEPFFTTKEQGKGTGLGLSMVYGAVKTHHGFVDVDSRAGKGTSFHVYIPLLESKTVAFEPLHKEESVSGHGELILLADDERHVREITTEVLEMLGYKVLQAEDGLKAMEIFKTHSADIALVILDAVMPHCSGNEFAQRIRKMRPDIPVLFVTGYDKEYVLNGNEAIANSEVLTKPVQFETMSQMIRQMLG